LIDNKYENSGGRGRRGGSHVGGRGQKNAIVGIMEEIIMVYYVLKLS
jgi:hypothetical protein